jgi:predicted DCC family thiol-disulfide oxidoreductase YuxK
MKSNDYSFILFDGICNFCNSAVNFIIRHDKKNNFKFAPIQSEVGKSLIDQFKMNPVGIDSVILIKGDSYYIKSKAFIKIIKNLKGLWKLFYILIIIPRPIRDFFYDILARNRYKWYGKREECMVPTKEIKNRFL